MSSRNLGSIIIFASCVIDTPAARFYRCPILWMCMTDDYYCGCCQGEDQHHKVIKSCLLSSRLTIDHESLSRWSTGPIPNRDISNMCALSTSLPRIPKKTVCLLILSPCCLAVCGHHLDNSDVFLATIQCTKTSHVTSPFHFPHLLLTRAVHPFTIHIRP